MRRLLILTALLLALPAHADTFYVDSEIDDTDALPGDGVCATATGACTLRAAIQETNALPGEDAIDVPAGNFVLAIEGTGEDAAATGDLDITDDLILTGEGLEDTIIDAAGLDSVFVVFPPDYSLYPSVEFAGVTVTGGEAGGISAGFAELSIFDSAVEDNLGSGIDVYESDLLISGSFLEGNAAEGVGGGIRANGFNDVTIEESTIRGNHSDGLGGGVYSWHSNFTIRDSVVAENHGGGFWVSEGNTLVERTTITNNYSEERTGGISLMWPHAAQILSSTIAGNESDSGTGGVTVQGYAGVDIANTTIGGNQSNSGTGGITAGMTSDLVITNTTIAGNHSDSGAGGIQVEYGGHASIHNTTISENTGFAGGGIALSGDVGNGFPRSVSLFNSTIVENSAQRGGGIFRGDYLEQHVEVQNSIVAKNTASLGGADCFIDTIFERSISSGGHNILGDASDCDFESSTGDQVGDADNPIDPRIGPLADNGGPTMTHALLAGSPAIDAIPVADCTYDDDRNSNTPEVPLTEDQRGVLRPQGEACDIGAYEAMSCDDGIDNDRDGYIDWNGGPRGEPADPGCADANDLSERSPLLVCDDGADNDGDGKTDFDPFTFANPGDENTPPSGSGDPACFGPAAAMEDPQCQDGINNDPGQDGWIDYDGGQSIWGECTGVPGGCPANVSDPDGDGVANPDPQCVGTPWKNQESKPKPSACGLGTELALLLPAMMWMWRRRRL